MPEANNTLLRLKEKQTVRLEIHLPSLIEELAELVGTLGIGVPSQMKCPKCRTSNKIKNQESESNGLGLALFLFGGLLPFLFFEDYKRNRVVCLNCGFSFQTKPPKLAWSNSSKVLLWAAVLLVLPVVTAIVMVSLDIHHEVEKFFYSEGFEVLISRFSGVVWGVILSQLILFGLFCLFFIPISNARYRTKLKKVNPKPSVPTDSPYARDSSEDH